MKINLNCHDNHRYALIYHFISLFLTRQCLVCVRIHMHIHRLSRSSIRTCKLPKCPNRCPADAVNSTVVALFETQKHVARCIARNSKRPPSWVYSSRLSKVVHHFDHTEALAVGRIRFVFWTCWTSRPRRLHWHICGILRLEHLWVRSLLLFDFAEILHILLAAALPLHLLFHRFLGCPILLDQSEVRILRIETDVLDFQFLVFHSIGRTTFCDRPKSNQFSDDWHHNNWPNDIYYKRPFLCIRKLSTISLATVLLLVQSLRWPVLPHRTYSLAATDIERLLYFCECKKNEPRMNCMKSNDNRNELTWNCLVANNLRLCKWTRKLFDENNDQVLQLVHKPAANESMQKMDFPKFQFEITSLTWHKKTNSRLHSLHFNVFDSGIFSRSSHAGRPPTLLGKNLFVSKYDLLHFSRKPKSTWVAIFRYFRLLFNFQVELVYTFVSIEMENGSAPHVHNRLSIDFDKWKVMLVWHWTKLLQFEWVWHFSCAIVNEFCAQLSDRFIVFQKVDRNQSTNTFLLCFILNQFEIAIGRYGNDKTEKQVRNSAHEELKKRRAQIDFSLILFCPFFVSSAVTREFAHQTRAKQMTWCQSAFLIRTVPLRQVQRQIMTKPIRNFYHRRNWRQANRISTNGKILRSNFVNLSKVKCSFWAFRINSIEFNSISVQSYNWANWFITRSCSVCWRQCRPLKWWIRKWTQVCDATKVLSHRWHSRQQLV